MPHLRLDVSENAVAGVDMNFLLAKLVRLMSSFDTVDSASVKAYFQVYQSYKTGEGAPPGFVHLTASVLSGRPLELRKQWSQAFAELLQKEFAKSLGTKQAKLTVEIREMDAETYFKG